MDELSEQNSQQSTAVSEHSQFDASDITNRRIGHSEHQLLWNSDESAQVMYLSLAAANL